MLSLILFSLSPISSVISLPFSSNLSLHSFILPFILSFSSQSSANFLSHNHFSFFSLLTSSCLFSHLPSFLRIFHFIPFPILFSSITYLSHNPSLSSSLSSPLSQSHFPLLIFLLSILSLPKLLLSPSKSLLSSCLSHPSYISFLSYFPNFFLSLSIVSLCHTSFAPSFSLSLS